MTRRTIRIRLSPRGRILWIAGIVVALSLHCLGNVSGAPQHLGDGEPDGVWCFYHDVTVRFPPPAVTCPKPWRPDRVKGS